jgi:diguanylate cyclase (GGDEF)-like protein
MQEPQSVDPSAPARRILVVEDSRSVGVLLRQCIGRQTDLPVDLAPSLAEARARLALAPGAYAVAVADLGLPDAEDGAAVDLLRQHGVPTIVLTGHLDEALRDRITSRQVVDYVHKQSTSSVEYVAGLVRRLLSNLSREALVTHGHEDTCRQLCGLLRNLQLTVLEAADGQEALRTFEQHPDIALVLTDHRPPDLDGIQLTAAVRARAGRATTGIIGVIGQESPYVAVQLLKAGADDILRRPLLIEEFLSRVNNLLNMLDYVRMVEESANRDYLTRLYNRRYLFEAGKTLFATARRGRLRLAAALIDLDHFKQVNDEHGHEAGDRVLAAVARVLASSCRATDLVARLGGEEFCVLAVNAEPLPDPFERLRAAVADTWIDIDAPAPLRVTVSVGVSDVLGDSLSALIDRADQALYEAKRGGRNRVVVRRE